MKKPINKLLYIIAIFAISPRMAFFNSPEGELPEQSVPDNGELRVHFVDVGQADCQIVELPQGEIMMIDFGNNDDGDLICNYLDWLGIDKIDYLIATHPHEDHIGSMDTVIDNYEIGSVYMTDAETDMASFRDVKKALSRKNLGYTLTYADTLLYSDDELTIEAVAPVKYYDDLNNMSIVIRLTYKDASFLFTGDAEAESEYDITADVSADVLSVGHHGSSTSTCDDFLERVDPMYAVISCGANNDYGHPHWETTEKLSENDVVTYRTDTMGTVICSTYGNGANDYYWEKIDD